MKTKQRLFYAMALVTIAAILIAGFNTPSNDEFQHGTINIGVVVEDIDRSLDFYTEVIGMTRTGGFVIDEEFSEVSGLSGGSPFRVTILKLKDTPQATEWKLMSFNEKANHPFPEYIQDDTGPQYITIMVNSMEPFLERLKEHRIKLLGKTPATLSNGNRFVLIQDPDGVFIELIGPE